MKTWVKELLLLHGIYQNGLRTLIMLEAVRDVDAYKF